MNSLEHMQQVFAKIRKPAAAAQQIHATYVTELLAAPRAAISRMPLSACSRI